MLQHNKSKWSAATLLVLLLAVVAMGQIGGVKVYACDLTDLGSCISGTINPYVAGQQDAVYDSTHGLAYHPMAACCHSDDYDQQFVQGYNAEWNKYQSQSANVNIENSPGAVVSVNQKSNQDQNQKSDTGCGNQCGCSGSCDSGSSCSSDSCGGACNFGCNNFGFHHFGFLHEGGFGYRHIGFGP